MRCITITEKIDRTTESGFRRPSPRFQICEVESNLNSPVVNLVIGRVIEPGLNCDFERIHNPRITGNLLNRQFRYGRLFRDLAVDSANPRICGARLPDLGSWASAAVIRAKHRIAYLTVHILHPYARVLLLVASNQAMASMPRIDASVSSFAAGPLGTFSPRSHLLTTPTVTFK